MRKILSIIVLLAISSTLSFGQNLSVIPSTNNSTREGKYQSSLINHHLDKNTLSNTKAAVLTQNFEGTTFPPTGWTKQNSVTNATLQWKSSTISNFGNKAAEVSSQSPATLSRDEWLISPSMDLTTIPHPCLTFYMGTSYHFSIELNTYDIRVRISTDGGTSWINAPLWTEDSVGGEFEDWTYYKRWLGLENYASSTNLKIAFQYVGRIASDAQAAVYLDDISVETSPNNNITIDRVTLHDGYMQIPSGLGLPMYYDANVSNFGLFAQNHVKLHGVDLSTGADSVSMDTTLLSGKSIVYINNTADFFIWNTPYFFTPSTTQGTYKVTSYLSTDSIPYIAQDTFNIKVVCDTCMYSRDNNTYAGWIWQGSTNGLCDPYQAANLYEVAQDRMVYGANCVLGAGSKPGSRIKALLYKQTAHSTSRAIVAQSANYAIVSSDIPPHVLAANPVSVSLKFTTPYMMQADSLYWIAFQVYGGTDSVRFATDGTGIPQWEQTSLYFDPSQSNWYIWQSGNNSAIMLRAIFSYIPDGINEVNNTVSLFSCMPNPANNVTKISYELKNNEKVSILITDITGRTVKTLNQGTQAKGNYSVDVDLSNLTSGTYFYTLKTATAQATDKLIIVKR